MLMEDNSKKLNFKISFLYFFIFIIVVALIIAGLWKFSEIRKEQVYLTYSLETNNYIARNWDSLIRLFNNISQIPYPCNTTKDVSIDYNCPQSLTLNEQINNSLSHDLQDWSSTIFLVKSQKTGEIRTIRLSGDIRDLYPASADQKGLINKLLSGEVSFLPWANYTYELDGKEVIIPVHNSSGQVIGAILRGVIEKKTF